MASNYPSGLDSLATNHTDNSTMLGVHAAEHNDENDAINKIEAELGLLPKGSYATVRARLDALDVLAFNARTASYTLVLTDQSKVVGMNVASANNLTVPLNSSVAFPVGATVTIRQVGAGQTTVVAGGGVTINSRGGALKLAGQWAYATLVKTATDTWDLSGDITT